MIRKLIQSDFNLKKQVITCLGGYMAQDIIKLDSFGSPLDAEIAANALQNEGITAYVHDESMTGLAMVHLFISSQDKDRAMEVLKKISDGSQSVPAE